VITLISTLHVVVAGLLASQIDEFSTYDAGVELLSSTNTLYESTLNPFDVAVVDQVNVIAVLNDPWLITGADGAAGIVAAVYVIPLGAVALVPCLLAAETVNA